MDLLGLLATHDVESLTWKLLCQDSLVKKWGHNCEVFEEKIYIFGGRTKEDSNELLCIAPETGVVEEITL